MKKELPRAYLAGRKGSQSDAIKYCKKGEKYHEFGNPREQGSRKDITAITKLISEGSNIRELISNEGEINLNVNTIRLAEKLLTYYEPPRDYQPTVLWLWVPQVVERVVPHVHYSLKHTLTPAPLGSGGGYDGHQDVILDDVREETFPYSLMLAILGAHPVRIEDKGTIRQFRGRRIIVTSPYGPSETYSRLPQSESKEQLLRRVTYVETIDINDAFYEEDVKDLAKMLEIEVEG